MKSRERGDTLIEVLIALTVLTVIVVGALAIMNRSLSSIINSTERTAVRSEINAQTELLNYARSQNPDAWDKIKKVAFSNTPTNLSTASNRCKITEGGNPDSPTPGSFYLEISDDAKTVSFYSNMVKTGENYVNDVPYNTGKYPNRRATTPAKRESDGKTNSTGIWIDAVSIPQGPSIAVPYYDFYIKACWTPLGNLPDSQTMTIVRIYDQQ